LSLWWKNKHEISKTMRVMSMEWQLIATKTSSASIHSWLSSIYPLTFYLFHKSLTKGVTPSLLFFFFNFLFFFLFLFFLLLFWIRFSCNKSCHAKLKFSFIKLSVLESISLRNKCLLIPVELHLPEMNKTKYKIDELHDVTDWF